MANFVENYQKYLESQISFSNTFSPDSLNGVGIYRFDPKDSSEVIPIHIRTGAQTLGAPTERKHFRSIEFHGEGINNGWLGVRVWIDGRYLCEGRATMTETGNSVRKVNLQVSKAVGYAIDIEFTGMVRLRGMEIKYEVMA